MLINTILPLNYHTTMPCNLKTRRGIFKNGLICFFKIIPHNATSELMMEFSLPPHRPYSKASCLIELSNCARILELTSNKPEILVTYISTKLDHQIPVLALNPVHFNEGVIYLLLNIYQTLEKNIVNPNT